MTQEALKLALEALKEISRHATTPWEDEWCGELADETLTAINALAQPEQRTEPPDWFPAVENILKEYGLQAISFVADFKEAMKDAEQSQRTWVVLTDKEIEAIWKVALFADYGVGAELSNQPFVHYARAIEAKLKEKNA